jgi:hypothetical protein
MSQYCIHHHAKKHEALYVVRSMYQYHKDRHLRHPIHKDLVADAQSIQYILYTSTILAIQQQEVL